MGIFLSVTSVVGKPKSDVVNSLSKYTISTGGGLKEETLSIENNNCCIIAESDGNTTIFNSYAYNEWDASSEFISRDLNAPVFSFHIHDGDLWMYILFENGVATDQFNPIPDYWDDNISEPEIESWKGNAAVVSNLSGTLKPNEIERYLVRWDLDAQDVPKAYPDDQYGQEDWQLLDFMRRLRLPYPLNNDDLPQGQTYKIWTRDLPLEPNASETSQVKLSDKKSAKPWWRLW